jgi:GTPase SAR1 family protein
MRNSAGALVVFDLTNRKSFYSIQSWLDDLPELTKNDPVVMIAGNKLDLIEADPLVREVRLDELKALAEDNRVLWAEVSAKKEKAAVEATFVRLIQGTRESG